MYWGLLYQKRRPRNDLRVMIKIFKDSYNIKHRFLTNTTGYNHLHYHVILVIISNSYCPYIMGTGPPFPGSAIPGVRHSHGPGFGVRDRVRVRRTVGMADPRNGGPEPTEPYNVAA